MVKIFDLAMRAGIYFFEIYTKFFLIKTKFRDEFYYSQSFIWGSTQNIIEKYYYEYWRK